MDHCQHCNKDFATPSSLKRHIHAKHPSEPEGSRDTSQINSCPHCHGNFTRRESLRRHIRNKHDRDLSVCSFCLKQFRADYMSQHKSVCARRYLKWLRQHVNADDSTDTACSKTVPRPLQLGSCGSPERSSLHLNGDGPPRSSHDFRTLRIVHQHVVGARLTGDALTRALLIFEETDDIEAYKQALAAAFHLNITFDSQGIRRRSRRAGFSCLAGLACAIDDLIRGHASIDTTYERDRTILHLACAAGLAELLEPLFWRGASFVSLDADGQTPLTWAVCSGDLDAVLFALALGADPNLGNPFYWASLTAKRGVMAALIENGASVNKTTYYDPAILGH